MALSSVTSHVTATSCIHMDTHLISTVSGLRIAKDPIFSQLYQLEIFLEDEQQITSLTFSRLFASTMVTRRKQGGDACTGLGNLNARSKHSCA